VWPRSWGRLLVWSSPATVEPSRRGIRSRASCPGVRRMPRGCLPGLGPSGGSTYSWTRASGARRLGGVAERFNAPVLKTGGRKPSWVRIPPPPLASSRVFRCCVAPGSSRSNPRELRRKRATWCRTKTRTGMGLVVFGWAARRNGQARSQPEYRRGARVGLRVSPLVGVLRYDPSLSPHAAVDARGGGAAPHPYSGSNSISGSIWALPPSHWTRRVYLKGTSGGGLSNTSST
jgi:hypothetical protein